MKASKRIRGTAAVTVAVVASGFATPGPASADGTANPGAGRSGGLGEKITLTVPAHHGGGGGSGNGGQGSGNGNGSGNGGQGSGNGGQGSGGQGSGGQGGSGGSGNGGGSGRGGGSSSLGKLSVEVPTASTVSLSGSGTTVTGYLGPVYVSDTRPSSPGWTVVGQASDSNGTVSGNALGWTPVITSSTGRVTVGRVVPPNDPGLGSRAALLGSSAAGGAATLGANLSLALPAGQAGSAQSITITITITPAAA